ncbi:MAG TPA: hypothetical protein VIK15_08475 [Candidatus Anoxymicrobiaceae bacterium]
MNNRRHIMLRYRSSPTIIAVVASLVALSAVVVLSAGCNTGIPDPGKAVQSIKDQTSQVARQANLAAIEAAISAFELANNGDVPTSINQLLSYLGGKIPVDPLGGTYYIIVENGAASAGVR